MIWATFRPRFRSGSSSSRALEPFQPLPHLLVLLERLAQGVVDQADRPGPDRGGLLVGVAAVGLSVAETDDQLVRGLAGFAQIAEQLPTDEPPRLLVALPDVEVAEDRDAGGAKVRRPRPFLGRARVERLGDSAPPARILAGDRRGARSASHR